MILVDDRLVKVNRIRAEAENILQYERDLTDMPGGLPTLATIDAGRIKAQVRIKMDILRQIF